MEKYMREEGKLMCFIFFKSNLFLIKLFISTENAIAMLSFRHDDLIIRNGLYAEMWSEQRKSTSDIPTNEDSVAPATSTSETSSSKSHHHPHV